MLNNTERRWLQERGAVKTYPAGYLMALEGESVKRVIVLMRGLATAVCVSEAGAEMLLRIYGPGDIIGAEAVLDQQTRLETVQALAECTALVIPVSQFTELHRSAGIARVFGLAMTRRIQSCDEHARTRLAPPQVRLARALLDMATRAGVHERNGVTIPVDLSQDMLAAWIGASRATVAREFSRLRQREIIRTGYRRISIIDPELLHTIAWNSVRQVKGQPSATHSA
jgi:CRP-like cAMP-binding protein